MVADRVVTIFHRIAILDGKVTRLYKELIFDEVGFELYGRTGGSIVGYDQLSCTKGQYVRKYFHRVITNCPEDMVVDHINGNSLDNRLCNLRICSRKENQSNLRPHTTRASELPKGVYYEKRSGRYYAKIVVNYEQINLGTFLTQELAHAARLEAERLYQGEFAYNVSRQQT